jgi:hypothetical protein
MADPAFLKDAEKIGLTPNPISGTELETVVKRIFATPHNLVELARKAVE